jgi:Rod binding domain-containing protein
MMDNANIGHVSAAAEAWEPGQPRTLREATREFESLFIAEMMKEMRATVPESGLLGSSSGQGVFREMLDQELSRRIAGGGGFGIGDLLYQQLAHPPSAGAEPSSTPAEMPAAAGIRSKRGSSGEELDK